MMEKLNYTNESITVVLVRGKEAPKSIREGSASFDPERRTSKRARKGSQGNNINLTVSCTTSVYQLKMMIWEAFGVRLPFLIGIVLLIDWYLRKTNIILFAKPILIGERNNLIVFFLFLE